MSEHISLGWRLSPQEEWTSKICLNVDECNITFFTKATIFDSEIFLAEPVGSAITDTACTRTVCGEKRLENDMKELSQDQAGLQTVTKWSRFATIFWDCMSKLYNYLRVRDLQIADFFMSKNAERGCLSVWAYGWTHKTWRTGHSRPKSVWAHVGKNSWEYLWSVTFPFGS